MNFNRLKERVSSARKICNASVIGYKFSFNKRSNVDGSGKGNIQLTNNVDDKVWGVVFEIEATDKPALDLVEGLGKGYNQKQISLIDENAESIEAQVYIADLNSIDNDLLPFDWYKEFVVTGAQENNLPPEYIEKFKNANFNVDLNGQRRERQLAILRRNSNS